MAKIFALHAEDKGSIPLNSKINKAWRNLVDALDLGSNGAIRKGSSPLAFIAIKNL